MTDDFVVLDEVLANLDHGFRRQLVHVLPFLVAPEKTVILTSHDAPFLRECCRTAMWLEGGCVRLHGPFNEVLAEYERAMVAAA